MTCIACLEPMETPVRPADPFLCPDCQEPAVTSVVVRTKHGYSTFARAVADVFAGGVLTVTATDTDTEVRTFPRGSWSRADVHDARGNSLATYEGGAL